MKIADRIYGALSVGAWAGGIPLGHGPLPLRNLPSTTVEYKPRLRMDIYGKGESAPVFLFIPGGAWVVGRRRPQGYALIRHLTEAGWICAAIDYRVAPRHRWPTHLEDVQAAFTWIRRNIGQYGGNPNTVALGGASAGAHMAALAGLTWDPKPQAIVGLYGAYDWERRDTPYHQAFMGYLERVVVGKRQAEHPSVFRNASPMALINSSAPPFLIVHGTADVLCPVSDARRFAGALYKASDAPVVYHEIRQGLHGFDIIHSGQTAKAVAGIRQFLDEQMEGL